MTYKHTRGFTLVELMLVIALIGILTSIILASIGNARTKGDEVKTKSQLAAIQTAATIYYGSHANSYGSTVTNDCTTAGSFFQDTDSHMAALVDIGTYPQGTTLTCNANDSAYAVSATLSNGAWWCVDSLGTAKGESSNIGADVTACP